MTTVNYSTVFLNYNFIYHIYVYICVYHIHVYICIHTHICMYAEQLVKYQFSSVQSFSRVRLFVTPLIAACQVSLSITNSRSSLKLISIESVMPSSHLILCCPLLLLPPIPPSIRDFFNVNSSHEVAKVSIDAFFTSSVHFSRSVMSDSMRLHESQHDRLPCPSPTPRVHSDSRPSSQ